MALALFDLDKTLLGGDSDFLWGEFLAEIGAVDNVYYQQKNQQFFDDYAKGELNIKKYLEFCLEPLANNTMTQLNSWHQQFMSEKIEPIILEKAQAVVDKHKKSGDRVMVITATNSFVTRPIVERYGISELLATEPEIINGRFSGKITGLPCFQNGKVTKLKQWLLNNNESLTGSYFYSDSFNDLPLLECVDYPTAVNADKTLTKIAIKNNWNLENWI